MAYSKRLNEVLGEPEGVLAGVSGGKASLRIARMGEDISPATVINLKNGQFGRDGQSLGIVARAYAKELLAQFGDEIAARVGARTPDAAEKWLLWVADPRLVNLDPSPTLAGPLRLLEGLRELQIEFPDEQVTIPRYSGGVRDMTLDEAEEWIAFQRRHILREREHPSKETESRPSKRLADQEGNGALKNQ